MDASTQGMKRNRLALFAAWFRNLYWGGRTERNPGIA